MSSTPLTLSAASALLSSTDNGRAFTEVYKVFDYKDDASLRDYLDFVVHEPAEWMRGFPAKWKSESQFARVRAAFHKLLKRKEVEEVLGATYISEIHDTVWNAFKDHMDNIVAERTGKSVAKKSAPLPKNTVVLDSSEEVEAESVESATLLTAFEEEHSVSGESVKRPRASSGTKGNGREALLEEALRILLSGEGDELVRTRRTLLLFLDSRV